MILDYPDHTLLFPKKDDEDFFLRLKVELLSV